MEGCQVSESREPLQGSYLPGNMFAPCGTRVLMLAFGARCKSWVTFTEQIPAYGLIGEGFQFDSCKSTTLSVLVPG